MTNTTPTHPSNVVYRGYGPGQPNGGHLIVIEIGGELIGPLPHHIKHSPTGMAWGYAGSGPADLARSLLIHALGDAALCQICAGTSEVVYDNLTDNEIPVSAAPRRSTGSSPEDADHRFSPVMGCLACEKGYAVLPSLYQQFKFDVVARLPEHGWTLSRADVLHWYHQHERRADTKP